MSTSKGWWRCRNCGYIYKPEIGNGVAGAKPGTSFAELPDDWICPVCFTDKDVFYAFEPED
jgi:rubredoxin